MKLMHVGEPGHERPVIEVDGVRRDASSLVDEFRGEVFAELDRIRAAAEDLPETVTRALELTYPKATYQEVEEVITVQGPQETLAHYEVKLVTAQRRTAEVQVSPGGKITHGAR